MLTTSSAKTGSIGPGPSGNKTDTQCHRFRRRSRYFLHKTCEHADVVFPATAWGEHDAVYSSCDRRFQRVRKLIEPQGDCKPDWEILCLLASAMGYPMHYHNTEEIWDEMRSLCPKFTGATYEKLDANHGIQWPCFSEPK